MTDNSRKNWKWCTACGALRDPSHQHGDELESLTYAQLLERCRLYRSQRYATQLGGKGSKPNGTHNCGGSL